MPTRFYFNGNVENNRSPAASQSTALPNGTNVTNNRSVTTGSSPNLDKCLLDPNTGFSDVRLAITTAAQTARQSGRFGILTTTRLAAQTIPAQTWTIRSYYSESNNNANAFLAAVLYVWRPSSSSIVGTIYDNNAQLGTEWTTAGGYITSTFSGSSVTAQDGDVLVLETWYTAIQGKAASYTVAMWYDETEYLDSPANITLLEDFVLTQGDQLQDADTFYAPVKTNFRLNQSNYFDDQFENLLPLITLDNPNAFGTSAADYFGFSVDISDSYTIVGAYLEDETGNTSSGKAYVFHTANGALAYTLDNPNAYGTSFDDRFGWSVAISDSYVIVGAYLEDDSGGTQSGKAYVFHTANGALAYTLNNPNVYSTSSADNFGYSVAISDSYAIVSAISEDDASGADSGKAYIFHTANGSLAYTLDNPNAYGTANNDNFGTSVDISNNYIIVGAYAEDDAGGTQSGKAYVYYTANGALAYTLDNPNAFGTSAADYFGISVAISDSYAIVGAYLENDAGGSQSGKAYVFHTANGALTYTLDNPNAYGTVLSDRFGASVAISDLYAIVGAYLENDASGADSGKAYVYYTANGALAYTLDNPNAFGTSAADYFGYSVAISDSYAIVGAYLEDETGNTSSGKAYVYDLNNLSGDKFFTATVALALFNQTLEQGAQLQDPDTFFQTIKINFTLRQAEQLLDDDTFYALLKTNFTARQIEQLIDTDEFYETVKTIFTLRQQGQLTDDDTFQDQVITLAKTTRRIIIT